MTYDVAMRFTAVEALSFVQGEMRKRCILDGFDVREHGSDHFVAVLYYSFIDDTAQPEGRSIVRNRVQLFLDGRPSAGIEVS